MFFSRQLHGQGPAGRAVYLKDLASRRQKGGLQHFSKAWGHCYSADDYVRIVKTVSGEML